MTDFAEHVLHAERPYRPVQKFTDIDFYKLTMLHFIWKYYREVSVTFELINREHHIPVAEIVDEAELRAALDAMCDVGPSLTDMTYIRGINVLKDNMFSDEFLEFLRDFRVGAGSYDLRREGNQYRLRFPSDWPHASMWEIYAMAIVMDLYFFSLERRMSRVDLEVVYARATARHYEELHRIKANPNIILLEGGTRRRHSFGWQRFTLRAGKEVLGSQIIGTSNVWMAMKYDMVPGGTFGHELQMVTNALVDGNDAKIAMVYEVLRQWDSLYGPALGVALPDTFMSKSFYRHAPDWLMHNWHSNRHDSGSPFTFGDELVIPAYEARGIDPATKMIIFSDGNKAEAMDKIERHFRGRIKTRFLQGTMFTNNFADLHPRADEFVPGLAPLTWRDVYKPFSLVCKAVEANGRPCVKLTDNITKATGPKDEVARYVEIFGGEDRIEQAVIV